MENVPVVDLSADRSTLVHTMDQALRTDGFFYVRKHGVDAPLIQQQWEASRALFDLPLESKTSMPFDPQLDIGYVGKGVQSLDPHEDVQPTGDTKEQFMMTNNKLITDPTSTADQDCIFEGSQNYCPDIKGYRSTAEAYASALFRLNHTLNSILFDALELDEETQTELGKDPFVVLKQMKYAGDPSNPEQGKFGAGAHCDWGAFTILWTDDTPGLEIQLGDKWLPVPPKPDCFIVNSGDQIAQLTNNVYRSAMHRVVTKSSQPRYSTAFFTYFGIQSRVGPLAKFVTSDRPAAYPHRTTLDYFHFKLHESMGVVTKPEQPVIDSSECRPATSVEDQLRHAAQTAIASWQNTDPSCPKVHKDCAFWVTSMETPSFRQGNRPSAFLPPDAPVEILLVRVLSHRNAAAVKFRIGEAYAGWIVFLKHHNDAWQAISVGMSPVPTDNQPVLPSHFEAVTALTWKGYCYASRHCNGTLMAEYFHVACRLTFTDTQKGEITIIDAPTFYDKVQYRYTEEGMHKPFAHIQNDHDLVGKYDSLQSIEFVTPSLALVVLRVGHPPCLWTDLLTCACDAKGRWWIVHKSSEMDLYLMEHRKNEGE